VLIVVGLLWLAHKARDWLAQRRMDRSNREEAERHAAWLKDNRKE